MGIAGDDSLGTVGFTGENGTHGIIMGSKKIAPEIETYWVYN